MHNKLSVITLTRNSELYLEQCLKSVFNIATEIIIVDDCSIDKTHIIANKYQAKIYNYPSADYGKRKAYGIKKSTNNWTLLLDSDEIVSNKLQAEIKKLLENQPQYSAYRIPFQNHLFNKPLKYGGENYQMIRLFKKDCAIIKPALVHEKVLIKIGKVGKLKRKINHYSYQSLTQIYKKFTLYALSEAKQKHQKKELSNLKKIFFYPIHMFWARFIKDKGYKDGFFRIPLDFGFAYMELLTYLYLVYLNTVKTKS